MASCSAFASSSAKSACTDHTHALSLPALGVSFISCVTGRKEGGKDGKGEKGRRRGNQLNISPSPFPFSSLK